MFKPRPCGCKGQRTCLVCEREYDGYQQECWVTPEQRKNAYVYCPECNLAWPGWNTNSWKFHPNHVGESIIFPGVRIIQNFVSEEEERILLQAIDEVPWDLSQSGRRKQNYGPKCNFKKRRVRSENFTGYPAFTKYIQDRFSSVDILRDFHTVEQCSLEYRPDRGASIDPHIDDCWIWGERIPTLSLMVDSILTLRKFNGHESKYNLIDRKTYPAHVREDGSVKEDEELRSYYTKLQELREHTNDLETSKNSQEESCRIEPEDCKDHNIIVRVPMPQRSLLVLYGPSRYDWEHGILREDIESRRICITYRELTPTYLPCGPKAEMGKPILEASKVFWDHHSYYSLDLEDATPQV